MYLYALGSEGENVIERFWVFNPDEKNVKPRFEEFIGIGIKDRFRFKPITFYETVLLLRDIYSKYDDPSFDFIEMFERR